MGRASADKKLRREVAGFAATRDWYSKQLTRPEIAEAHSAALEDAELQERWRADLAGQLTRLRRAGWVRVAEGTDGAGWHAHPGRFLKLIHSVSRETDGQLWGHFSMSLAHSDALPTWYDLRNAQWLLYPDRPGVQVVAPPSAHVSIGEILHIWTCLTADVLPAFGRMGSI
jgi:hypothetical protein